ncbi:helix-turn-helix domain-containing protein [Dongia sp.]|uniref:helix-turn-helix domain-containing protein n=1 Tax=Dongia sp. TaxID=1977262 RepID=UPI0034A52065
MNFENIETDVLGQAGHAAEMLRGLHGIAMPTVPKRSPSARQFRSGATIYEDGDPAGDMFELVEGTVMLHRTLNASERQIVEIALPGALLGLAWQGRQISSAQAITQVNLRVIDDVGRLDEVMNNRRLILKMIEQIGRLFQNNTMIGCGSAVEKLAYFLINATEYRSAGSAQSGQPIKIRLVVTRRQIGEFLGVTLETVSRAFSQLRKDGIIGIEGYRSIQVYDHVALRKLATGAK